MTTRTREVIEGPQPQGVDERIVWALDISEWGSNPTGISVVVKDEENTNVTSTVMTGTASAASATVINLPVLHTLTAGVQYRVEVKFTVGGNVLEGYFIVVGEM